MLASAAHLRKWVERNRKYESDLTEYFDRNSLVHDLRSSLSVAKWSYQQAEKLGANLWVASNNFEQITSDWAQILPPDVLDFRGEP